MAYDGSRLLLLSSDGARATVTLEAAADAPPELSERRGYLALILSTGQELARATLARLPELAAFRDAVARHLSTGEVGVRSPRLAVPPPPPARTWTAAARGLVAEARPHAPLFALSGALTLGATALSLAPPLLVKVLVDSVLRAGASFASLAGVIAAMGVVMVLTHLTGYARRRIDSKLKGEIVHRLRVRAFDAATRLALADVNRAGAATLAQVVMGDAGEVGNLLFASGFTGSFHALMVAGIVAAFLWMSPWLALVVLTPAPLVLLGMRALARRGQLLVTRGWIEQIMLGHRARSLLDGFRVVKAFGAEAALAAAFTGQSESTRDWDQVVEVHYGHYQPLLSLITGAGSLAIWGYGGWLVLSGRLGVGSLVAFVTYLAMLYAHVQALSQVLLALPRSWSAYQRFLDLVETVPEVRESPHPVRPGRLSGAIRLERVSFSYVPGREVLHDVDLVIEPGELVGLVGRSGSGKTTLVNLVARFYDPDRGRILLDGHPLDAIDLAELRRQVALVLQQPHVFSGTVLENLRLARPDATLREVCEAADRAQAHRFILALPDGYDTRLSDRVSLSAGELARLTIARALLSDPRILILDEATASLDASTEQAVGEALAELTRGRTTLAIAHRLTTLARADRLVVLDAGRVVDSGRHAELVARPGPYADLVAAQSEMMRALSMKGKGAA